MEMANWFDDQALLPLFQSSGEEFLIRYGCRVLNVAFIIRCCCRSICLSQVVFGQLPYKNCAPTTES